MSNEIIKNKLLRVNQIIGEGGLIPISAATWWNGVKSGYYPQPVKLGPNITAWRWEDIQGLIQNGYVEEVK